MSNPESRLHRWLAYALIAFAATLPLSIALVQPPAYAAVILFLIIRFNHRHEPAPVPRTLAWTIGIFLVAVVLASALGVRPGYSFSKMNRFLILLLVWAIPMAAIAGMTGGRDLLRSCLIAFLVSLGFKAAFDFVRVPVLVSMATPLFHTGNMRDPQLYLTGLCLVAGMLATRAWRFSYPPVAVSLLFSLGGLVLHFKRGAWVSAMAALLVMAIVGKRWKLVGFVVLSSLLMGLVPAVQERIGQVEREFDADAGGRMLLWREVAPQLIPEHPLGMGWRAVKHEDFLAITPKVEKNLKHLHNNLLQITLELGYAGLLAWSVWMLAVLFLFYRIFNGARAGENPAVAGMALGLLGAFTGILVNGMVEYNFGDSEIFMLMILLMGLGAGLHQAQHRPATRS